MSEEIQRSLGRVEGKLDEMSHDIHAVESKVDRVDERLRAVETKTAIASSVISGTVATGISLIAAKLRAVTGG